MHNTYGLDRKMKGYHAIKHDYSLISLLNTIVDENYERWGEITELEILQQMMERGKGHLDPKQVIEFIKSYRDQY